jgi:hypothetical protein
VGVSWEWQSSSTIDRRNRRCEWRVAAQGPETGATTARVPTEAEFVVIRLSLGMTLERLPTDRRVDDGAEFADVSRHSVRIFGHTVPLPGYDDAEDLVQRMVRAGVIVRDPMVSDVLGGWSPNVTARTDRGRRAPSRVLRPTTPRAIVGSLHRAHRHRVTRRHVRPAVPSDRALRRNVATDAERDPGGHGCARSCWQ